MRFALVLAVAASPALCDAVRPSVLKAELTEPTLRYDHGVLGDAWEWGGLELTVAPSQRLTITLPENRVFEDITARISDLDGDGATEVLVVETDLALGASLAVYGSSGKITATKFIGQTHRWLAPAGVGDFDGDGRVEIAYVDRPHLLAELVFLRLEQGKLTELARVANLTNHRIGNDFISGGVRDCGQGAEVVLASADWSRLMAVNMRGAVDLGAYSDKAMKSALACR